MVLEYAGQRVPVAAGDLVIGSDSAAGLALAGEGVHPRHALVRLMGAGLVVIQPLSPDASILVNGARLGKDPTPLMHGDRVRIGPHEIRVSDPQQGGDPHVLEPARDGVSAAGRTGSRSRAELARLVSLSDGREYPLEAAPFILGRDAGAQVVIASPDASRRHAEIVSLPAGDVVVDLSASGTYVNGQRVSGAHRLRALDVIRIGAEELRYYPAARAEPEPLVPPHGAEYRLGDTLMGVPAYRPPLAPRGSPLASLLVKSGTLKGERLQVLSPVVNLGRAEYNDLRLPDPSVGASHARLQLREGVWLLTDLGSDSGTTVDGDRIEEETPLPPGTTVRLGDVALLFEPLDRGAAPATGTAGLGPLLRPGAAPSPPATAPLERPRPHQVAPPPPLVAPPPKRTWMLWVGLALLLVLAAVAALVLLG